MTDFETATLTAQYATAIAQVLIGLGQIAVVWYGINRMVSANDARALAGERQERESERRHTESMTALQGLIRGLDNQGEALKQQGQALSRQSQALETLIARTGRTGTA